MIITLHVILKLDLISLYYIIRNEILFSRNASAAPCGNGLRGQGRRQVSCRRSSTRSSQLLPPHFAALFQREKARKKPKSAMKVPGKRKLAAKKTPADAEKKVVEAPTPEVSDEPNTESEKNETTASA